MKHKSQELYFRDMIWGSVWGALALILPFLFHPFGLGSHLMPMFAPLLIAALTLDLRVSLTLALTVPLISSFLTGMPPLLPPIALMMILEAVLMMIWVSVTFRRYRWNIYPVLIGSFLVQRVARMVFILGVVFLIDLPPRWLLGAALLWGLPGAVIQVVLIPRVIKHLQRGHYLGNREWLCTDLAVSGEKRK